MSKMPRSMSKSEKLIVHPFLWKYLAQEDLIKLDQMPPKRVEKYLGELFKLDRYKTDLVHGSTLDYYISHYWWAAKQKNFNIEQTSVYFSIAYMLLENLRDKHLNLKDNLSEFKGLIAQLRLYNNVQLQDITDYIFQSLFQHYRMYEYLFFDRQHDYIVTKEINIEAATTLDIPSLDESLPEKMYNRYILKITEESQLLAEQLRMMDEEAKTLLDFGQDTEQQLKSMFDGLKLEDAKRVIQDVTNEMVTELKVDLRKTLKERETALINELIKTANEHDKKPIKSKHSKEIIN